MARDRSIVNISNPPSAGQLYPVEQPIRPTAQGRANSLPSWMSDIWVVTGTSKTKSRLGHLSGLEPLTAEPRRRIAGDRRTTLEAGSVE
jgi:hypothetical protein